MGRSKGYLYYQAGQAVAAVHLGLTIKCISGNPADAPSEIVIPRDDPKARMILWFAGMAAESRGKPLQAAFFFYLSVAVQVSTRCMLSSKNQL